MPNVALLIERGVRGVLESTMPPITPVAFSSFITGVNPGKHGIFDWTIHRTEGVSQPANAAIRRGAPFWHYLNRAGVRVGAFNIPMTYPPQLIGGFLVPGITVPNDTRDLTSPPEVLECIEDQYGDYRVGVPHSLLDESVESYTAAWLEHEEMQTNAALMLMEEYNVDVLAFNYASLDRVNHFSPYQEHLENILINVDAQIGRFVECYPEADFILMSDHGSRRIKNAFLLGKWLVQNGYAIYGEKSLDIPNHEINFALARYFQARGMSGTGEKVTRRFLHMLLAAMPSALRRPIWNRMHEAESSAFDYRFTERLDWERTAAFATSNSGPLFLNANGHIKDYDALREGLIQSLMTVEDPTTGEGVFSCIHCREDIYHGPALSEAPDLIADHYNSTCDLIVDNEPGTFCFVNRLNRFGDHTSEGIFVLSGPGFVQTEERAHRASIMDLPATLLHLYGVPIPDDFDGRVLTDFLTADAGQSPVQTQAAEAAGTSPPTGYEEADQEQVIERLRQLGYL